MAPFFPRQPIPVWDYIGGALMAYWCAMYILGGVVRVMCPKTYAWAKRKAER